MRGIIIKGVTGTGKTTLIETLKANGAVATFISEEETTGELLTEIVENRLPRSAYTWKTWSSAGDSDK